MTILEKPNILQHRRIVEADAHVDEARKKYREAFAELLPPGTQFIIDGFSRSFADHGVDYHGEVLNHMLTDEVRVRNVRTQKTRRLSYYVFVRAMNDGLLKLERHNG